MMLAIVLIVILALLAAVAKTIDLKRKRNAEAVHLQSTLSDVLVRERGLVGLAVTPTAHAPLWRGSPVVIQVSGIVPSKDHRETVMQIVNAEAARIRPDVRIEDLLVVGPVVPAAS